MFETGGPGPDNFKGTTDSIEFPTFQVRVRGTKHDYDTVRTKLESIRSTLVGASISGLGYVYAVQSGPLSFYDTNERPNLTLNFQAFQVES